MPNNPVFLELRDLDQAVERETAKFLDKNYYRFFTNRPYRIFNREEQLKGKDLILTSSTYKIQNAVIDEKTASHYVAHEGEFGLPTFAFELSFFRKSGDKTLGWLLDANKETEYYFLTWPWAKKEKCIPYDFGIKDANGEKRLFLYYTCEDIIKLEFALISRKKLLDYLSNKGFSPDRLIKDEQDVRENSNNLDWLARFKDRIEKEQGFNFQTQPKTGFYYQYTWNLPEKPVNLVIYKNTLKEIAEKMSFIRPK